MKDTENLINSAIDSAIFPGAVIAVSLKGKIALHKAFGQADIFAGQAMTTNTFFDLASLTKPLATAPAIMALEHAQKLELDQPIIELLPALDGSGKEKITVRQLLTHTSGFPDWRPWFIELMKVPGEQRNARLQELLIAEPLDAKPGKQTVYSDLGFMLLAWLIEEQSGQRLDRYVNAEVYGPLNIEDLFYLDRWSVAPPVERFAATQLCPWRNRLLKGQVDDDNTWAMGGVGGQAGLFGTAVEVCALMEAFLLANGGTDLSGPFSSETICRYFERSGDGRALGFDVPTRPGSSSGQYFSDSSVGHLGFTGTSFWADPERGLVVVLLTNRVHPYRFNEGIRPFRPKLHDMVIQELGLPECCQKR